MKVDVFRDGPMSFVILYGHTTRPQIVFRHVVSEHDLRLLIYQASALRTMRTTP
jgi:hypothetical protein